MNISQQTTDFMIELNEFSHNKIKNINDVTVLLELSNQEDKKQLFKDIIFIAKYLNGLGKIMQQSLAAPPNGEASEANEIKKNSAEKIREEYKNNIQHLINQLKFYLHDTEESFNTQFADKYFALNRTSLVNLTTLVYDLSWVKKFINRK